VVKSEVVRHTACGASTASCSMFDSYSSTYSSTGGVDGNHRQVRYIECCIAQSCLTDVLNVYELSTGRKWCSASTRNTRFLLRIPTDLAPPGYFRSGTNDCPTAIISFEFDQVSHTPLLHPSFALIQLEALYVRVSNGVISYLVYKWSLRANAG
jgi:hypothetical protein